MKAYLFPTYSFSLSDCVIPFREWQDKYILKNVFDTPNLIETIPPHIYMKYLPYEYASVQLMQYKIQERFQIESEHLNLFDFDKYDENFYVNDQEQLNLKSLCNRVDILIPQYHLEVIKYNNSTSVVSSIKNKYHNWDNVFVYAYYQDWAEQNENCIPLSEYDKNLFRKHYIPKIERKEYPIMLFGELNAQAKQVALQHVAKGLLQGVLMHNDELLNNIGEEAHKYSNQPYIIQETQKYLENWLEKHPASYIFNSYGYLYEFQDIETYLKIARMYQLVLPEPITQLNYTESQWLRTRPTTEYYNEKWEELFSNMLPEWKIKLTYVY